MRRIGIRVAALAQDGLTYGADDFDLDRYRQLSRLAAELLGVSESTVKRRWQAARLALHEALHGEVPE